MLRSRLALSGEVVGHVAVSPVTLSDGSAGWFGLGPISVLPEHQQRGIGSRLMREVLQRLRDSGARGCVLVGDPGFYQRFRFRSHTAAQFSKLGDVEPFGVPSPTQFLPAAPPQLESDRYALDFKEVKNDGRRPPNPLSTNRADYSDKQRTALLWAGGGASGGGVTPFVNVTNAFRVWHNVARDVAQADSLSLVQTARLFALLTTSIFDSVQTSHTSKFIYRLWRPETAIRAILPDEDDNNPNTLEDDLWLPLLSTPPYASHSSNMTCIGAGAAQMLANVFKADAKSFTVTWYKDDSAAPAVVHSQAYNSFWALAQEEGNSRIWGGIHFRFEIDESLTSCAAVADYLYDHYMQERGFYRD